MRIARYSVDGQIRYGVVELAADGGEHPDSVADVTGDPLVGPVKWSGGRHDLAAVRLLAPVLPRSKVVGLAFDDAAADDGLAPEGADQSRVAAGGAGRGQNVASPDRSPDALPAFFLKPNTSVIGPEEPVVIPARSHDTRLAGHVAVVISRICRHVPEERVPEVVFGQTVAADVTAVDWQRPRAPWGVAKSFDSFTPLGPWIVTHLSLDEAGDLTITTRLDGRVVHRGVTQPEGWPLGRQIAWLSDVMTLLPGDVVLMGRPVGAERIEPGQVVSVDIDEIGRLTNPVVAEEA